MALRFFGAPDTPVKSMKRREFAAKAVHEEIRKNLNSHVGALSDFVTYPGVSAHGFREPPVLESAQWVKNHILNSGIPNVEILQLPDAAPYIFAEIRSPIINAKTVLVYAHYDVQPTGDEKLWHSPPFKADLRQGRLFGRGTADDKSGIIATLAAVNAFIKTNTPLPCHIKFLFDGEEESGSPNILKFLKQHRSRLKADRLIVPDLVNPDEKTPSLTFSMRGLVEFEIEISTMTKACHSGLASGAIADATAILAKLYAAALGKRGEVIIPGVGLTAKEKQMYAKLKPCLRNYPTSLAKFRKEFGLLSPMSTLYKTKEEMLAAIWFAPALTLVQTQVAEKGNYANRLQPDLKAVFSLRLAPHQKPAKIAAALKKYFERSQPYPARIKLTVNHTGSGFFTDPMQKSFRHALEALAATTNGKNVVAQGAGLTIPFVYDLQNILGKMETYLVGIEDPQSNAHAENESLSIATFEQTIHAIANLYSLD